MRLNPEECHNPRQHQHALEPLCQLFKNLKVLTHIDIQGSLVDDVGIEAIAVNGDHLVSLKAAATAITNVGVKSLCIGDTETFCLR